MSTYELFADEIDGRLYAAVLHKSTVQDLYVDPLDMAGAWGSIYLGKVTKIDTKLDAAFVDMGSGQSGLLPAKHIYTKNADASETRTGIAELLQAGQMIMVQIKSEAKKASDHENHKLPRLTTKIYIFGQFLNYCPNSRHVAISRKLKNPETHAIITKLPGTGGWIAHISADKASEEDLHIEAKNLLAEWDVIEATCHITQQQPRLLRAGPNAVYRALHDYSVAEFEHIYAGNKKILDLVIAWAQKHAPALAASKRLRLHKPEIGAKQLFDTHDIHTVIDELKETCVSLPTGGSIVLEQTQAFMVIDVNQGSAGSTLAVNKEATLEIARHIRLRNLSGALLIDFINLPQKSDRAHLLETFETALSNDRGHAQVHGFTRLGIIEVTRKRRTASFTEKLKY